MRARYADSYIAKYEGPFAAYLFQLSLDGCDDELGSVDEIGYWFGRLGRYVLVEDSNGQCFVVRTDGRVDLLTWVTAWLGHDPYAYERVDQ
jgi:hypothetical protein